MINQDEFSQNLESHSFTHPLLKEMQGGGKENQWFDIKGW